ncbi:hypothetical protein ACRE_021910 [Hapsidospora chrysogenum ATCC 11550]|uniref:Uncharacterized protein n=1 Tax=Hapsidospora chrysogenum (strain ATCC 11550 / CBS 779.69 / DSM 880 / IAM 14645 / JCM 23072 / IMI 49137) TaxID=857340 RepID=A0A086TC00_HAPC1|nr:hypothetical protein ACRE_021910 [Hapsidospora chrysogenum ATCC 11550]
MADEPPEPQGGDVFGAFNALLGYIGGQAATITIFERFLWPQRHFAAVRPETLPRLALFYPMAGPVTPVALEVIDGAYRNGLFAGAVQGHMLGTAFYRDLETTYTLHAKAGEPERESQVRNCLWVQALLKMPLPELPSSSSRRSSGDDSNEEGRPSDKSAMSQPVRSRVAVNHLVITKASAADIADPELPFVGEKVGHIGLSSLLAICLTEISGIGVTIGVAVILRSLWSIVFIVPLVIRLLSALLAVHREGVSDLSDVPDDEPHRDWEVQVPAIDGKFVLISGPPSVVNQFFRHYGHPVRNRFREVAQIILVVAFGTYFPVILLCQVLWMPGVIQYVFTIWQVFIIIMMHMDRFSQRGTWRSTTEARIGRVFATTRTLDFYNKCSETSLLFGQNRKGPGVVKATLNTTLASSYGEGKKCMRSIVELSSQEGVTA